MKDTYQRDQGRCRYCNKDMTGFHDWAGYTIDHLVPRCAGGKDVLENVVLACSGCNNLLGPAKAFTTFEARKAELERIWDQNGWRKSWQEAEARLPKDHKEAKE